MEWISVKEKLPEVGDFDYGTPAIVVYKTILGETGVTTMLYVVKKSRGKMVRRWEWRDKISPWEVTHWMPLPEPPKE